MTVFLLFFYFFASVLQEKQPPNITTLILFHTVLEAIEQAGKTVGNGIRDYLSDTQRMLATVGVIGGIALSVYAAK